MATLQSYDLNGKKLSFANWISNLSPEETPFTSMTGKESITQTLFQWQNDALSKAGKNAIVEGIEATDGSLRATTVRSNLTQILRKTVKVSDTANALANYGRGKELQYQMEKAGSELKRDLEWAFLNNEASRAEYTDQSGVRQPRETAGFLGLVAHIDNTDPDTGAVVHKKVVTDNKLTESDIFDLTYNLYLAGSSANIIMFHPKWAAAFSALQEKSPTRVRMFENTPKLSVYVSTLVDPLGQEFKLIPNRWMPEGSIFFLNPSDWTQMVLRAPMRTKLAKDGSYEKWMIETEVGLRLRHPFAAGVLDVAHGDNPDMGAKAWETMELKYVKSGDTNVSTLDLKAEVNPQHIDVKPGTQLIFKRKTKSTIPSNSAKTATPAATDITCIYFNGKESGRWTGIGTSDLEFKYSYDTASKHNGDYYLMYMDKDGKALAKSAVINITVK
jgi:hypothetical protein